MVLVELVAGCQASKIPVELKPRLKVIISKLEKIAEHKDVLGLKESFGGKHYQRLPTTSLVDECKSGELHGISEKTRHFSCARDRFGFAETLEALTEAKFLRTLLPLSLSSESSGSNFVNQPTLKRKLQNLRCLRALSLSHCPILEFPDIFGNLKHLRFLDFSRTEIKALPESTCSLYNLQTLMLSDCTKLTEMPPKFGRLKNLQILTTFVVSNSTGASLSKKKPNTGASSISELGGLLQLRGKLSILKLQNVQDSADAEKAKLKDKKYVKELAFHWDNSGHDQQKETDVLEKLRPHENIEKISIKGYHGTKWPDWLGNTPKLTSFSVSNCNSLQSMPEHMHAPNLTSFSVSNCSRLQSLPEHMRAPPKLTSFSVSNCNSLQSMPEHMHAPNLTSFSVSNCSSLQSLPEHMRAPNLTSFSVSNCSSLQSLPEHMHAPNLISLSVSKCSSLQQMHTLFSTSLGKLEISCCPKLESFPNGGLPPNLKTLLIEKCDRLTVHNDWGLNNMTFLTCLTIKGGCSKLNSFPAEGLLPASLKYIQISEFPVLKTLDLKGLQRLALLKELQIDSCDSLQCFSEHGTLPSSLSSLSITGGSFLTQWCHKGGKYWPKICDIQIRKINGDVI
ncbi:hypothetical protein Q3G72_028889 [Acer saccharum]|nr:hypothetical protein Q3G72_002058 [Acer saccharum]KAK1553102.1 hypothetical protein Q3G72_028889 [Acer saccharum]